MPAPIAKLALEDGTLTDRAMWDRLLRVFQGEFIGFAFWFN